MNKLAAFERRYPSAITIEVMDICNLRCRHCHLQSQVDARRGFMDYDSFKEIIARLIPLLSSVDRLNFSSVESLFHPRIFDMIDLVRLYNKNSEIYINTNGMLLDDNRIDNLLSRNIRDIHISLDGCKKETVEAFKTGVDFNRVIKNLKRFKEKGNGKVNIRANFVLHKNNRDELIDYIDFCKDLGVAAINVIGFISYMPKMADYCFYSGSGIKEIDDLLKRAQEKAQNFGVQLRHHGTKIEPVGCRYASDLMYIDRNANVAACSLLTRETNMFFLGKTGLTKPVIWGNVLKDNPLNIWRSESCVNFRRLLDKKQLPKECSLCAIGYGVIC